MYPWNVIKELENTPSRLEKEGILRKEVNNNNIEFFTGCKWALDSLKTFGVKQIPEKTDGDGKGLTWDDFSLVIDNLYNRVITGNNARKVIEDLVKESTKDQWNYWYRRILIKDLRCGLSEKTINKVVKNTNPEYVIPVFSCQLAQDCNDHAKKMSGKKIIQTKLDGVRVLTIVRKNGFVEQYSRNGKQLLNFQHIKTEFESIAPHLEDDFVFDGEVMSSSFQDLMKQVYRKRDVNANDAVLYVFDMIPLNDFNKGICRISQHDRNENLSKWFTKFKNNFSYVDVLDQEVVDLDDEVGYNRLGSIYEKALENKYEGIMIKNPNGIYECKRNSNWLKMKPKIEVSLKVLDVVEGTGKYVNSMGALICSGEDSGKFIVVNVGSGFSDEERSDIWNNVKSIRGQIVEIIADTITMNQDGTYSLRFPRFKCFRGFDVNEKL